ncbi:MAG TPA: hypothetical protein VEJ46_10325 [Candidatus Acidoferrum sp.]|nr:hypothetical protein [Candidatus Acidoferrum sp.]
MNQGLRAETQAAVLPALTEFLRARWLLVVVVSILLLVPCFWHHEIVSSDLGSHLYNAWLVQLIHRGQVPGLWIAPQHTNVLFDWMLSGLGSVFGLRAAEKLAVSIAVLIFFWGAFALVSAARRAPWPLTPVIALVTYGWTFHLGFFNYYLSLGLSFLALAVVWRGKGWERLAALLIAPLVLVAHPLGFIWLLAASAYIGMYENVRGWDKAIPFGLAVASLLVLHFFLSRHYFVNAGAKPFYSFNGADQLVLFGERYRLLARALLAFAAIALGADLVRRYQKRESLADYLLPVQFYVLAEVAVLLLPDAVIFPPPTAAIALLTERLTSVSAILGCWLLGAARPGRWHFAGSAVIAAIFFSFLYQDTATVNRMEGQVEQLVSTLPPNRRVMATIFPFPGSRILVQHIVDRACIARCFSYGNYEPGAAVFRVRATPGNPYVLSDYDLAVDMEHGGYVVQPGDLPVYQIYQCSASGTDLCITSLEAGEENDRLGEHPSQ